MNPASIVGAPPIRYQGLEWVGGHLPVDVEPWEALAPGPGGAKVRADEGMVRALLQGKAWLGPPAEHYFFPDLHADGGAILRSLVASGGVDKFDAHDDALALTEQGRTATFVFGGDLLAKGPSDLRALRIVWSLIEQKASVVLLAGNHDLRIELGLRHLGARTVEHAHLFARMGVRSLPLLREVLDEAIRDKTAIRDGLTPDEARRRMFPGDDWYREYPAFARAWSARMRIDPEIERVREKVVEMEREAERLGMDAARLWDAARTAQRELIEPGGAFSWFFPRLRLVHRAGSVLFVHAGVDDEVAHRLRRGGCPEVDIAFREGVDEDPNGLYHGPLGNVVRTRYRARDAKLGPNGIADLHAMGVRAILHGHGPRMDGQELTVHHELLHFACDTAVDGNTRAREGMNTQGGAATIVRRDGRIWGVSTDHSAIKIFDPARYGAILTAS
jgi:hypothetical protein